MFEMIFRDDDEWYFFSNDSFRIFSSNSYNCVKRINYVIRRIRNRNQINVLNIAWFRWYCICERVFWSIFLFRKNEIETYRRSFSLFLNKYDENDDKNFHFLIQIRIERQIRRNERVKSMTILIRTLIDRCDV